ncbi:MAG: prepilin-type N-terminal cleavage/methylation domain-containing protein [Archangium sp.]|nr:prepilin-type N-terminal cleavage/methylation domain-containing protein [Archangium sp.]
MTARQNRGFTLLEVMITVGIVAIVTGLAVAGGQSMVINARSSGEAEIIASFLRNSGLRAISTGCAHKVRYRGLSFTPTGTPPTAGTLQVYRAASCQVADATQLHVQTNDWLLSSYSLTQGVQVKIGTTTYSTETANGFIIGFQSDGTLLGANDTSSASASLGTSNGFQTNGTLINSATITVTAPSSTYNRLVTLRGGNNVVLR